MKTLILIIASLLSLNTFAQKSSDVVACDEWDRQGFSGRFVNPAYDGMFNAAFVEFTTQADGEIRATISIPSGTKVTPSQYRVICRQSKLPTLELISEGSSQCTLGDNIIVTVARKSDSITPDKLEIYTKIRTPGFNGNYELTHQ